jgi:Domain of unknown function (DUF4276)
VARRRSNRRKLVFLVGEGKHDIGGLARGPEYQTDDPGFLQPILRQLAADALEFRGQTLSALPRERMSRPSDILTRRGFLAARLARHEEAAALVIVTDVDSEQGRSGQAAAERRMARLQQRLAAGISRAELDVPALVGTPLRTIEAWVLGDPAAVRRVARRKTRVALPKPPEQMWGAPRDPGSLHPKQVLRRQFDRTPGQAEYAAVGLAADVEQIERSCPVSFAPFAKAVRDNL